MRRNVYLVIERSDSANPNEDAYKVLSAFLAAELAIMEVNSLQRPGCSDIEIRIIPLEG